MKKQNLISIAILVVIVFSGLWFFKFNRPSLIDGPKSVITVGSASGNRGTSVDLPVSFTAGGTSVSALQFELSIPSGLTYTSISTGSATSSAGKSAIANLNGSTLRVIISGLNQDALGTGQLASVRLSINTTSSLGALPVNISGIVGSNPSGGSVSVTGTNGAVTVQ